ncbi:hypothetical protein ACHAXS_010714 [Conticribra weissflogii]
MTKQSHSSSSHTVAAAPRHTPLPLNSSISILMSISTLMSIISTCAWGFSLPPTSMMLPRRSSANAPNIRSERLSTIFRFHATQADDDDRDDYRELHDDDDDYKDDGDDDDLDDEEEIDLSKIIPDFETKRMEIVRILQKTYYRSMADVDDVDDGVDVEGRYAEEFRDRDDSAATAAATTTKTTTTTSPSPSSYRPLRPPKRPQLDKSTGKISHLPLWRVGWVETPGRRNCLNVHEGTYTHMFETILASQSTQTKTESQSFSGFQSHDSYDDDDSDDDDNWMNLPSMYFGHLYLPGGTSAALSGRDEFRLKTWKEELEDESRFETDRSAVLGCLMQIVDHRRMDDGRLVVLVQAVERFAVEEVRETKPYCVADVQILLDQEDLPGWNADGTAAGTDQGDAAARGDIVEEPDESECKHIRGEAVAASFHYHDYEFDDVRLPIAETTTDYERFLSKHDVPWLGISKLLPFARYSSNDKSLDVANEKSAHALHSARQRTTASVAATTNKELPLERQLWNGGILWNPPPVSKVVIRRIDDTTDCDALETLLWLAIDDFCRATKFVLPDELRCLVPPEMDYLDITAAPPSSSMSSSSSSPPSLSPMYPKIRRQRRLSYLAPALIENLEIGKDMRQIWLNTPSTRARLLGVLERFDYLNNQLMGQFE